jgi:hypothetical protein
MRPPQSPLVSVRSSGKVEQAAGENHFDLPIVQMMKKRKRLPGALADSMNWLLRLQSLPNLRKKQLIIAVNFSRVCGIGEDKGKYPEIDQVLPMDARKLTARTARRPGSRFDRFSGRFPGPLSFGRRRDGLQ